MCPACDGDLTREIRIAGVTLQRCSRCDLYLSAFDEAKEASYASIDSDAYLGSIARVRRTQSAAIVTLVRRHLTEGDWLDVGCGYGYVVEAARATGYAARGIEPNRLAMEIARGRGVEVTHGVLSEETPPADVISTLDVLEHIEDINSFAQLAKRKARRLWVIKVPSSDGLFFRTAHTFRIASAIRRLWQSRYEHPHRVYFNESSLRAFLEKHGFEVIAARYLQEIPARTAVARLTLDGAMPRWKAWLALPVILAINVIERLRGRSDTLLMIAKA